MVVSLNRVTLEKTSKYYIPYYGNPKRVPLNLKKLILYRPFIVSVYISFISIWFSLIGIISKTLISLGGLGPPFSSGQFWCTWTPSPKALQSACGLLVQGVSSFCKPAPQEAGTKIPDYVAAVWMNFRSCAFSCLLMVSQDEGISCTGVL